MLATVALAAGAIAREAVVAGLIVVGSFFLVVGTIGLLRFPDVYNRLHATSKASTLGAASLFLAGFVVFTPLERGGAGLISLVGIVFLFLTAPTGAHLISQAAHRMGVPLLGEQSWPGDEGRRNEGASRDDEGQRDEGA